MKLVVRVVRFCKDIISKCGESWQGSEEGEGGEGKGDESGKGGRCGKGCGSCKGEDGECGKGGNGL